MGRFYCEYCDVYLKSGSHACRKEHNFGRKHINNKIDYYQSVISAKKLTPPLYEPPPWVLNQIKEKMRPILGAQQAAANAAKAAAAANAAA